MHTLRLLVAARLKRVVTRAYRTEINAKRNTRTYPSPRCCSLPLCFSFPFASNLLSSHPRFNLFSYSSRSKLRLRKRAYYSPSSSICDLRAFLRFPVYARTTRNTNRVSILFFIEHRQLAFSRKRGRSTRREFRRFVESRTIDLHELERSTSNAGTERVVTHLLLSRCGVARRGAPRATLASFSKYLNRVIPDANYFWYLLKARVLLFSSQSVPISVP